MPCSLNWWWELGLVCLIDLHYIWNQSCILGSLGHHAWKCVIGGPRIEAHAPLSHYHDKGHGWCIYALNCAAMLCLALCCCQLQVLQEYSTDRQCKVPAGNNFFADSFNFVPMAIPHCRWQFHSAGGDPLCPREQSWGFDSLQRSEGRKTEAAYAWRRVSRGVFPVFLA